MRQRASDASEIWVRRNLFLTIVFVCFGSRYVEVRCVCVTSNTGFQNIPRILGQVELSQDGYSISEPSERGDLVQNPRWRRSKDFHVQLCFWDIEWLTTKIPHKTEETKKRFGHLAAGARNGCVKASDQEYKTKMEDLKAGGFIRYHFCALEAAFDRKVAPVDAPTPPGLKYGWYGMRAGRFSLMNSPESKVFMSCNYCSRWWWLVEVLFALFPFFGWQ